MSALIAAIGALLIACVALVVWPLMRPRPNAASVNAETQALTLYRQQLAELDRAAAEDGLDAGEAAALKVEIKRRMLAVAEAGNPQKPPPGQPPSGVRLRLTAAAVALLLAGASIALYGELGTPGIADQPLAARRERAAEASAGALTPEQKQQLEAAAAGLARKLAAAPMISRLAPPRPCALDPGQIAGSSGGLAEGVCVERRRPRDGGRSGRGAGGGERRPCRRRGGTAVCGHPGGRGASTARALLPRPADGPGRGSRRRCRDLEAPDR